MKRILFAVVLICSSLVLWANDVILCKDSSRLEVNITEVTPKEIKYKKVSTPDGPIFVLPKSEIRSITYSDGEVWQNPRYAENKTTRQRTSFAKKESNYEPKIKFTPTPVGKKHIVGLTVGYISKQSMALVDGKREGDGGTWLAYADPEEGDYFIPEGEKEYTEALAVGLTITPEFKYGIGIQTGVYYEYSTTSQKSYETKGDYNQSVETKQRLSDHVLAIPLRLQYRYEIIPDLSVFFYTGPKFEIGLSSKYRYTKGGYTTEGVVDWEPGENLGDRPDVTYGDKYIEGETKEVERYKSEYGLRRYRFMWGVGAGVQWKYLQFRLGGDWGLSNVARNTDYGKYTIVEPINLCLTYLF